MKFKTLLSVLLLSSIFSIGAFAQCSITNLIIEASACDADGFVTIDIEFDIDNPGSDNMFTISGNGTDYGQFEYGEDFYTIGPVDGNCITTYEVIITDVNDNDCSESVSFGMPFCCGGCDQLIVDYVGLNDCTGSGTFFMDILIDHPTSETFDVWIDGVDFGTFEYGEEVYTFGPFTGDCSTTRYISVQDLSIFCESEITLEPVCCPEYCSISNIIVEAIECTDVDQFSVELNFDYAEVEEDNFDFWANGSYHGTYAYADLPIIIDDYPQEANGNNYVTVFGIGADELCADDFVFEGLECEEDCTITQVEAEALCTDDGLFADVWFSYDNTGTSNQFVIDVNGQEFGPFEYGETFYTVGPMEFPCDQAQFINVVDIDDNTCSGFFNLELEEGFCCDEECEMTTLDFGNDPECIDGLIVVTEWLIDGDNLSEVGFDIYINDVFETFVTWNEDSSYDFDIEDPGVENFVLKVCDNDNADCCILLDVENPCYEPDMNECTITQVEAEAVCNDDGLYLDVWFSYDNPGASNQFIIEVWGEEFGPFEYGESFYNIGPVELECEPFQPINVTDVDNNDCTGFFELELPDQFCCDQFDCSINNLVAEALDCNVAGEIYFEILFDVSNPGADNQFTVVGNGNDYGAFEYGDDVYTVGPFEADCETEVELIVTDLNDNDCSAFIGFDEIFCCDEGECDLNTLDFGANPACVDGLIVTDWLIDGENLSEVGFDIYINDVFETFVEWNNDAWYDFDIEDPGTVFFTLKVCDNDNEDCCIEWELDNPCYEPDTDSCSITNLGAEAYDCNGDGEIYFDIFFDVVNPGADNQFTVVGNGNDYGTYEYGDDFYTVGPFIADCETEVELIVTDLNDNDCSSFIGFDEIFCCDEDECSVVDLSVETSECDDGTDIEVNFNIVGGSGDIFITLNDQTYGPYSDATTPITYISFLFDTEYITVTVCDAEYPNCCATLEVLNPCYDGETDACTIVNLGAEAYECNEAGEIYFDLFFEVNNPGSDNQFTIVGNGNNYGTFEYGQDFYTVGPFLADCETEVELIVTDVNNNDCSAFISFDEIFCCDEGECAITTLDFGPNPECQDGLIVTEWLIDGVNLSEVGFDIFINGEFETFVTWNENSWYGFDIENPETETFTIKVCDNDNEGCCIEWELENPCYDNENGGDECVIEDVSVEQQECDDQNQVYFTLTFNNENPGASNQFTVVGNGNDYGTFEYGLDFYQVGPITADCETELEFIVTDVDDNDCSASIGHDPACCEDESECALSELSLETSECFEDNTFNLTIDIEVNGDVNDFFDLYINGDFIDFYEFAALPITLEEQSYDTEYITVEVCENDNPDCCLALEVMNPCTEEGNQQFFINDIEVEFISCVDDMIMMSIDLDHGDNNDQFSVTANGIHFGDFNYFDLPIMVENIPADGVTEYTFTIFDTTIDDLSNSISIGTLACDGDIVLDSEELLLDPENIKSIKAYDVTGRLLGNFDSEENLQILGIDRSVSSGIIILRIDYGTQIVTKKIVRVN